MPSVPGWLRVVLAFVGLTWVAAFVLCVAVAGGGKRAGGTASSTRAKWEPYAKHDARERAIANRRNLETSCKLTIPGTNGAVPLFPTEDGLDEFAAASNRSDTRAQTVALRSRGAVIVPDGARCAYLDHGPARSNVRVLDGDRIGASGWTLTEWTRGQ